jgi:hypothetical protein
VAYVDLGKYTFTTGQDYTGLNTGNLTSVLPLSSIKIPYFEMYRLTIDTSALSTVTPIPVIVQDSGLVTGSSLSTLAVTMGKATTKGNTLIGVYGSFGVTLNPTVTGITIGAAADNWGAVTTAGTTGSDGYSTIWADPSCATASTAVVISTANGSGSTFNVGRVWEVADMLATTSPAASCDQSAFIYTDGGDLSSFAANPGVSTAVNDFAAGIGMISRVGGGGINPLVAAPWTSLYASQTVGGTDFTAAASSYGFAGPAGTSFPYDITISGTGGAGACEAMFFASAIPVAAPSFPFTVSIDQQQWDMQVTAAGTGYTYNIGDSPLYLRNSQNLEVLWTSLPYSVYATYAPALRCTAWFRYDPTAQQAGNVSGHA